jgi:hypothetical protein
MEIMPQGLAVLKWDDELGPVVTSKTPKKLKVGLDATTSMRAKSLNFLKVKKIRKDFYYVYLLSLENSSQKHGLRS